MSNQFAGLRGKSLVVYLPNLNGGGAERLQIQLASAYRDAGLAVTFLLNRATGELLNAVPKGIPVVSFDTDRQLSALPKLIRFLRVQKPDLIMSNTEHASIVAIWAQMVSRARTRVIVTQHSPFSEQAKRESWKWRLLPMLYRLFLSKANAVVAVSKGVAQDLSDVTGLPAQNFTVIYNGVISADFDSRISAPPGHPWANDLIPIVLSVGRLVEQKDHVTLLRAFSELSVAETRLIILGEGPTRAKLSSLVLKLGIGSRVDMPGYVENPLPLMRVAKVVVLSSQLEGFGNVLAEALACGTNVVSTDCPYGPSEILEGGLYGCLVPIGDASKLSSAILRTLEHPISADMLRSRGLSFSVQACAYSYLSLFNHVLQVEV